MYVDVRICIKSKNETARKKNQQIRSKKSELPQPIELRYLKTFFVRCRSFQIIKRHIGK